MTQDLDFSRRAAVDRVLANAELPGNLADTGSYEWTHPGDEGRLTLYVEQPAKEATRRYVLVVNFRPGTAEVYSHDIEG